MDNLYAIFRRNLTTPDELPEIDRRSQAELDRRPDEVRKIRTYVFEEEDGTLGALCLYEANNPDAVLDHSRTANIVANEVRRVTAIDVHRADPPHLTT